MASGAMKDLEKQLSDYHFFRGHRGYLINLEHVEGMKGNDVIVKGKELPVSRTKRKAFMEALSKHWGETLK